MFDFVWKPITKDQCSELELTVDKIIVHNYNLLSCHSSIYRVLEMSDGKWV